MAETVHIGDRPITLIQVLKLANVADSGGHAKQLVADGLVRVNGEIELRKRRRMAVGDTIEVQDGPTLVLA